MTSNQIRVGFFGPDSGFAEVEVNVDQFVFVEQLLFSILEDNKIKPAYRPIFGLKLVNKSIWLAPNYKIHDLLRCTSGHPEEARLECRMRFRPSSLGCLKVNDKASVNFIFAQLRHDFIHTRYNDEKKYLILPNPDVLGIITIDLIRYALEKNLSTDELFQHVNHRDFVPHKAPRWQRALLFWLRDKMNIEGYIRTSLEKHTDDSMDERILRVKLIFIEIFLEKVCPNYGSEVFNVTCTDNLHITLELRVRYNQKSSESSCVIETKPIKSNSEWMEVCDIYSICYGTSRNQSVEINRTDGRAFRINLESDLHAKSFLTLVDGYYRLMRKWHFNLCRDVMSPDLEHLRLMKCHGPIGSEDTRSKLLALKKPGAFMVRRSQESSQQYFIEGLITSTLRIAITVELEVGPETKVFRYLDHKINKRNIDVEVRASPSESLETFVNDLEIEVKNRHPSKFQMRQWLPPSETGDYPALLLSIPRSKLQKLVPKTEGNRCQAINEPTPKIIPPHYIKFSDRPPIRGNNNFDVKFGSLRIGRDVIIKSYSPDFRTDRKQLLFEMNVKTNFASNEILHPAQLRMADWIFLEGSCIAETLGVDMMHFSLIQEYFPLGALDKYLLKQSNNISEIDRRTMSVQLSSVVMFLQENKTVHGKIRCHNLFLKCINPIQIKLTDPLGTFDPENDVAFLPPELISSQGLYRLNEFDFVVDVWALGTTLWQIYNNGRRPPFNHYANVLKRPADCPDVIWRVIETCWIVDPASRASPLSIHRDLNDALVWGDDVNSYDYSTQTCLETADPETVANTPANDTDNRPGDIDASDSLLIAGPSTSQDKSSGSKPRPILNRPKGWSKMVLNNMRHIRRRINAIDSRENAPGSSIFNLTALSDATISTELYSLRSLSCGLDQNVWQVDSSRLHLGIEIGRGSCGVVRKGILKSNDGSEEKVVAVKCINNETSSSNTSLCEDLKREVEILKNLDHHNIIKTLGFVNESRMMLIVEYLPLGSLQSRMRNLPKKHIHTLPLHKYAIDIASGMEYLESMKIVHRDLALRNIFLKNENEVRICDFGLVHRLEAENHYSLQTNRPLPLKWYAPETLRTWMFTHKSDVWSYGVLLWEMYSAGATPHYSGPYEHLLETLEEERLERPEKCPHVIYGLMRNCWSKDPNDRDSFSVLVRKLMSIPSNYQAGQL